MMGKKKIFEEREKNLATLRSREREKTILKLVTFDFECLWGVFFFEWSSSSSHCVDSSLSCSQGYNVHILWLSINFGRSLFCVGGRNIPKMKREKNDENQKIPLERIEHMKHFFGLRKSKYVQFNTQKNVSKVREKTRERTKKSLPMEFHD